MKNSSEELRRSIDEFQKAVNELSQAVVKFRRRLTIALVIAIPLLILAGYATYLDFFG